MSFLTSYSDIHNCNDGNESYLLNCLDEYGGEAAEGRRRRVAGGDWSEPLLQLTRLRRQLAQPHPLQPDHATGAQQCYQIYTSSVL